MIADLIAASNVPELDKLRTELVLRHWVMARLEARLREEDARIFLVTGPPGRGKTSFAAQVVLLQHGLVPRDDKLPSIAVRGSGARTFLRFEQ